MKKLLYLIIFFCIQSYGMEKVEEATDTTYQEKLQLWVSNIFYNKVVNLNQKLTFYSSQTQYRRDYPLFLVCEEDCMSDSVEQLLEKGANPYPGNYWDNGTALHRCVLHNSTPTNAQIIINKLIQDNKSSKIKKMMTEIDNHNHTPLDIALINGKLWAVELFLKHQSKITSTSIECLLVDNSTPNKKEILRPLLCLLLEYNASFKHVRKFENEITQNYLSSKTYKELYDLYNSFKNGISFKNEFKKIMLELKNETRTLNKKQSKRKDKNITPCIPNYLVLLPKELTSLLLSMVIYNSPNDIQK